MTDLKLFLSKRAKLTYGLRQYEFQESPNFDNAVKFFITCRKFNYKIPEEVLQAITVGFIEMLNKKEKNQSKRKIQKEAKSSLNQIALDCYLDTGKISVANELYYSKTKEHLSVHGFRAKIKRYLEKILTDKVETPLPELLTMYAKQFEE